jgi:hypothetical protein
LSPKLRWPRFRSYQLRPDIFVDREVATDEENRERNQILQQFRIQRYDNDSLLDEENRGRNQILQQLRLQRYDNDSLLDEENRRRNQILQQFRIQWG